MRFTSGGSIAFLVCVLTAATPAPKAAAPAIGLQGEAAQRQAEQAGIDIGSVIETISHRVEPKRGTPDRLAAEDRLYRAEFDTRGFSLKLGGAPAFRVATARASRGDRPLVLAPAGWRSERNSALRLLAPGLSERVTARAGRVEWDFLLERAPPGRGALRIVAHTSAGRAVRPVRARSAWRFSLGNGRSVRVGELVVQDAHGHDVYRALPTVSGSTLAVAVPGRVLRRAAYPLTIDPVVSPEYPVSTPTFGSAQGNQVTPAVAFDGTNYFVVWSDRRSDGNGDIYGARVGAAGNVLDPSGIAIFTGSYGIEPEIAFDGTNYLVVFRGGCGELCAVRVTQSGTVLDPEGIHLPGTNVGGPEVAFDGTNYLVVWPGSPHIYGARVSPAGTVLDPVAIQVSTYGGQGYPAVAFDGTNYLVVWEKIANCSSIHGRRVSPAGAPLGAQEFLIGGCVYDPVGGVFWDQRTPAVAFNGTNYLVAWEERHRDRFGEDAWIIGRRVTPGGAPLGSAFYLFEGGNAPRTPAVASDGANWLVVWEDEFTYAARVTGAGGVIDPFDPIRIPGPGSQYRPNAVFGGGNYLVVWDDGSDVYAGRLTPGGETLDPNGILITAGVNSQLLPSLAFDGTNFFVAWTDTRSGAYDVFGARVSQAGALLDGAGIEISAATNAQAPDVAFDGTNYLVVWQDRRRGRSGIYGARVTPDGNVLDPAGIPIATTDPQEDPAVAFDGTNYLVVWTDDRNGGVNPSDIYGSRVSPAGNVLDPAGIAVSTATNLQLAPALAFDGANYLVVWQDRRSGAYDVYGARVAPSGSVVDPSGVQISAAPDAQSYPAIAFDGTNYLVVWQDLRSGVSLEWDVYGARVTPTTTVLDPGGIPISTGAGAQEYPSVAFDGTNYLAAWQDDGSTSSDIYAARVSRVGAVFDPGPIATAAGDEGSPSLVRSTASRVAVAYQRTALEAPYSGTQRVFLRFVDRFRPRRPRPGAP